MAPIRDPRLVFLFVPNLIGYARFIISIIAIVCLGNQYPVLFCAVWLFWIFLDICDGAVARAMNQVSKFGAFLDVIVDNIGRSLLWMFLASSWFGNPSRPPQDSFLLFPSQTVVFTTCCLLICVEWITLASISPKDDSHWKTSIFCNCPYFVRVATVNNFKSPIGILVMSGLHLLPLYLYCRLHQLDIYMSSSFDILFLSLLVIGRVWCLCIEIWVISAVAVDIATKDMRNRD